MNPFTYGCNSDMNVCEEHLNKKEFASFLQLGFK